MNTSKDRSDYVDKAKKRVGAHTLIDKWMEPLTSFKNNTIPPGAY
jgi:hypothetical protein